MSILVVSCLGRQNVLLTFVVPKAVFVPTVKSPPKDGRFGPNFSDSRAHPMTGDSIPYRAPFGPDPTLAPILEGDFTVGHSSELSALRS